MKRQLAMRLALCLVLGLAQVQQVCAQTEQLPPVAELTHRRTFQFDSGWRFHRGGALGAEETGFDDSGWRRIDLPHDWSIEDLPGRDSPFDPDAISQVSGGFTTGGTGWYRKMFVLPAELKTNRIIIQFDGVYMNAEVWLNGVEMGRHPYGYTSFSFDASGQAKFGATNLIAVKVQNEGENSRWYSGSGIYRHVWLEVVNPLHVAQWGGCVTASEVSSALAKLKIQTPLTNETSEGSEVALLRRILAPDGAMVATLRTEQPISGGGGFEFVQTTEVKSPRLWSVESPELYTCVSEVYRGKELADRLESRFGIRSIAFDAAGVFRLNGQAVKLKGGCVHHDNGPLGARAYDRAEERKIEVLKGAGFNAIRCAHNPPSPALLDACDRLGMLVIDEAFDMWEIEKNPFDYHLYFKEEWQKDMESMVLRDRNHPSVIMWSIGNEIPFRNQQPAVGVAQMLGDFTRKLDPTRPITSAVNHLKEDNDAFFKTLDVAGYNYAVGGERRKKDIYETDHGRVPGRVMFCSESYPLDAFGSWMAVLAHPYVIGDFVWTAWDYIGEASIGWRGYNQSYDFYPWNLAYCGDFDICGWKRPQSFYRDALWKEGQVALFVRPAQPSFELNPRRKSWSRWHFSDLVEDWTWPGLEGRDLEITAFSSCEEVELIMNGKSLGRKATTGATEFTAVWQVQYEPGSVAAIGYVGGKKIKTAELLTAAAASQVRLQADRTTLHADGQDLSYIAVELTDSKGVRNPKAENLVQFELEGPATIVGVANANPMSTESYQEPRRKAWRGRCLAIVKAGTNSGEVVLRTKILGFQSSEIKLRIK